MIIYDIISNLIYENNEAEIFEKSKKLMEITNKIIIENSNFIYEVSRKRIKSFYDIVESIENNKYENYTQIIDDIETIHSAFKESFVDLTEAKLLDSFLQFIEVKIDEEIIKQHILQKKPYISKYLKKLKNVELDIDTSKTIISKTKPTKPNEEPLPVHISWKMDNRQFLFR